MLRITCILSVVLALNQVANGSDKLFLTVLYESKCGDSRDFIANQLVPTIKSFEDHVYLNLVPFGKAHQEGDGFKCQHGPSECLGNLVQNCALDLMRDYSDVEKAEYVKCEMIHRPSTRGDMQCVRKAGISTDLVRGCMNSQKGFGLQLEAERVTFNYNHKFIPTVVFNGKFNQQSQNRAQHDLRGAICSYVPHAPDCSDTSYTSEDTSDYSY